MNPVRDLSNGKEVEVSNGMNKDKRFFFILLAVILAVLTYSHAVVKEIIESPFVDFSHYWINAKLLKEGYNVWKWDGDTEKRMKEISEHNNFPLTHYPIHSSAFFIFILPFTLLSFRAAIYLWLFFCHLLLFCSLWLILKTCKDKYSLEDLFIVLFLVFSFWPIREQLHMANPNFLSLLFLSLSLFLMKKERMVWSGFFFSMAIQTREYLGFLIFLFLWRKKWSIIFGAILGFIALKGLAILSFGFEKELSYWKLMASLFGRHVHTGILNHSIISGICRIGKGLIAMPVCVGLSLISIIFLIAKAFLWLKKNDGDFLLEFSLFLVLSFLVTPWVHESHYLALYLPIIILWFKLEKKDSPMLYGLFILSYLLLGLGYSLVRFPRFHYGLLAIFTTGKLWGVIILFFLIGRLIQTESLSKPR